MRPAPSRSRSLRCWILRLPLHPMNQWLLSTRSPVVTVPGCRLPCPFVLSWRSLSSPCVPLQAPLPGHVGFPPLSFTAQPLESEVPSSSRLVHWGKDVVYGTLVRNVLTFGEKGAYFSAWSSCEVSQKKAEQLRQTTRMTREREASKSRTFDVISFRLLPKGTGRIHLLQSGHIGSLIRLIVKFVGQYEPSTQNPTRPTPCSTVALPYPEACSP